MSYRLLIRPEAEADLAQAYRFYQECRRGLGDDFILCAEEALERVNKNPVQYQDLHKGIRRVPLHRFPISPFMLSSALKLVCSLSSTLRAILSIGNRARSRAAA